MKILYHYRTRSKDGTAVHIEGLVAALRRQGHQVTMVGPPIMETSELGSDGAAVAALKKLLPRAVYEALELAYNITAFRRLRRALLEEQPDALYERYALPLLAGVWLKRLYGIPLLLEVNAPLVEERAAFGGLGLRPVLDDVERMIWRSADLVLPVTQVLAEKIRARGVDESRIMVVPNGVGPEFLPERRDGAAVRTRYGLEQRIVLGFTGFVREWHGLEAAIDAVAAPHASPGLHLLVAGDGPARSTLEAHARRLGASDRVTFAGVIPRDQIVDFVAAFDIALQPRAVSYASPLKIFEYMAAGRAIVAPDLPNIREILSHERTAILIEPQNPDALRAAVERLARDSPLRLALGKAAREEFLRRGLTWDVNAQRVIHALRRLCGDVQGTVVHASETLDRTPRSAS